VTVLGDGSVAMSSWVTELSQPGVDDELPGVPAPVPCMTPPHEQGL
jgi:hypothetical protein